jgi:hypothetical protein
VLQYRLDCVPQLVEERPRSYPDPAFFLIADPDSGSGFRIRIPDPDSGYDPDPDPDPDSGI